MIESKKQLICCLSILILLATLLLAQHWLTNKEISTDNDQQNHDRALRITQSALVERFHQFTANDDLQNILRNQQMNALRGLLHSLLTTGVVDQIVVYDSHCQLQTLDSSKKIGETNCQQPPG